MSEAGKVEKKPRRYRRVEVRMWGDEKFRNLTPIPPCGQGLWVFLLTGPHTGPIPGIFRSGRAAMAEELNWDLEAFDVAYREASDQGMVKADWKAKVVWIPNALSCNKPESPNVITSWGSEWDLIPECDLKREAWESLRALVATYGEAFLAAFDKALPKPSGKPNGKPSGKASSNQEQEQEQEQEEQQEQTPLSPSPAATPTQLPLSPAPSPTPTAAAAPTPKIDSGDIEKIFAYWQQRMKSPRSALDDKRRKAIRAALEMGYSPADLCKAIRGCSLTPHNMGNSPTTNPSGQKYNGITLILRSADQIDRFIANDTVPPRADSPQSSAERREAESDANLRAFLGRPDPNDPTIIEMES